jgi:hypothetical protein
MRSGYRNPEAVATGLVSWRKKTPAYKHTYYPKNSQEINGSNLGKLLAISLIWHRARKPVIYPRSFGRHHVQVQKKPIKESQVMVLSAFEKL